MSSLPTPGLLSPGLLAVLYKAHLQRVLQAAARIGAAAGCLSAAAALRGSGDVRHSCALTMSTAWEAGRQGRREGICRIHEGCCRLPWRLEHEAVRMRGLCARKEAARARSAAWLLPSADDKGRSAGRPLRRLDALFSARRPWAATCAALPWAALWRARAFLGVTRSQSHVWPLRYLRPLAPPQPRCRCPYRQHPQSPLTHSARPANRHAARFLPWRVRSRQRACHTLGWEHIPHTVRVA